MNADDTAVIADDARDAKRYRYLRDRLRDGEIVESTFAPRREHAPVRIIGRDIDAAIDAAIAAENRK